METESKESAPGALALVEAFVNTRDLEEPRDDLASPAQLETWLRDHGLLRGDAALGAAELERAIAVREALRALLLANNGSESDPAAIATLQRAAAASPLVVRFDGASTTLEPAASGLDGAMARLLAAVHAAMADGTWPRLKACRSDTCHWAFYDHSKNRSGAWCSMATCGCRVKARTYRQRRRQDIPSHQHQRVQRGT